MEISFTGVPPLTQTAMTPKPAGPPDGGWGWVVAASTFAVNGLSYGLLRCLGLALPDFAEHFERSAQDTAWVSALALAVQQAASEGGARGGRWELGGDTMNVVMGDPLNCQKPESELVLEISSSRE